MNYSNIKKNVQDNNVNKLLASTLLASSIILFFLMLVVPRTYQSIKLPFLFIVLISSVVIILNKHKIPVHTKILFWCILYSSFGILWGAYGLIMGKEFAYDFLRLNVMWVFVYLLMITTISKPKHITVALKVMIWATLSIAIYNINFALYGMGYLHIPFLIDLDMGQNIGIHSGYVQLTAHNLGSLSFLAPFIYSAIKITKGRHFMGQSKYFLIIVLLTSIIALFLSGRRILWIIAIITPIIYFGIMFITKNSGGKSKYMLPIILVITIVGGQYFFFQQLGWDVGNLIQRLTFSGEQAEGYDYRINATSEIILDVSDKNVLIGTGGGDPAFEISMVQIFHETGLIGVLIYLSLFLWVYFKMYKLLKAKKGNVEQGVPLLCGSICFFLGMLTNPYFGSFDFMWILFLPLAYLNVYLRGIKD